MDEAFKKWWDEKYAGNWRLLVVEDYIKQVAKSAWDKAWEEA